MRVAFFISTKTPHQYDTARALKAGMARCGDDGILLARGDAVPKGVAHVATWGWRRGRHLRAEGLNVLVMERAYIADRFRWISLGWNGLNGRATWPAVDDGGARWQQHFAHCLRPWREPRQGGYALICGQVPTDTACLDVDFQRWARETGSALSREGWAVRFRPHPKAPNLRCGITLAPGEVVYRSNAGLTDAFDGAAVVVTYNSNTGVDAVVAGVPTVALDEGSMAFEVASHDLKRPIITPDRAAWAARLAWRQWLPTELADGSAWHAVRSALPTSPGG